MSSADPPTAAGSSALLREGVELQRAGRLREAEQRFRQVLQNQPKHPQALFLLGALAQSLGKHQAAEQLFRHALHHGGGNPRLHFGLATVLQQTARQQAAIESLREATALEPTFFQAWYQMGICYHNLGELPAAVEAYRRAQALDRRHPALLVKLGSALNSLEQPTEAIALYRDAIVLAPEFAVAHGNLGNALSQLGEYEAAISAFERCIELRPDNPIVHANLGSCHLRRGALGDAREAFAACLKRNPGDITALAMKAALHNEFGEHAARDALLNYDELMLSESIGPPDGLTLAQFNEQLAAHVLAHPTLEYEPGSHTTQQGKQTGSLLGDAHGAVAKLAGIIEERVSHYLDTYADRARHSHRTTVPQQWRLDMWATVLDEGGHQTPHIHPSGWLSGVYYVAIPPGDGGDEHGWIEFGRPPPEYAFREPPKTKTLRPRAGLLVLFPSYFYHRTLPFSGTATRISIAFDVVPMAAKHDD